MNHSFWKTIEMFQVQVADEVSDVFVALVVSVPQVQVVAETAETPKLLVAQFPRVQVVEEAVEITQLQVVKKIGVVPEWFNSVKGVVDSEDFLVCISRERDVVKKTFVKSRHDMFAELDCDEVTS